MQEKRILPFSLGVCCMSNLIVRLYPNVKRKSATFLSYFLRFPLSKGFAQQCQFIFIWGFLWTHNHSVKETNRMMPNSQQSVVNRSLIYVEQQCWRCQHKRRLMANVLRIQKCDKSKKRNVHTINTQRNRITYIINKIINKDKLVEDFQACPARRRPWSRTGKHYNWLA